MSHTVSGVDGFVDVTVPDDGEAAVATAPGVPASRVTLEEVVQELANRDEWLRLNLHGHCEVLPTIRIVTSALEVSIGAITGLILGRDRLSKGADVLALTGVPTGWRHLYAYNDGGVLEYETSATGPEGGLVFKSGDTSRRFLASFYWHITLGAAAYLKTGRRVTALRGGALITGPAAYAPYILEDTVLFAGTDLIPAHVSTVFLRVEFQAAGQVRVRPYTDAGAELTIDSALGPAEFAIDVRRDGAGRPVIDVESIGAGVQYKIFITGWEE